MVGIILGNVVGGVFMALHAAQGPQLGVPQMVQTRGQFGSYGALLVVVLVVLMYIGFFAANLVLGVQSLATITPSVNVDTGIVIVGVVSVVATIFGYKLIHAYTRLMTFLSGAALVVAFVLVIFVHGIPASFTSMGAFSWVGFMGVVSASAVSQIAYAPYVSDYSRYMPHRTGTRPAFRASYAGCVLGSILPMLLGALIGGVLVALHPGQGVDVDVVAGFGGLTSPMAILIVGIMTLGVCATNSMNLYCGVLSTLTIGQTFAPRWLPRAKSRAVTAIIMFGVALSVALIDRDNFLVYYSNFLSLLLYVLVPWRAINLMDYYVLRHGEYKVADFFRQDGGIYGRFNVPAVACYVFGALIQLPFISTAIFTGPVAQAMGGVDISWIVGLVVVAPVYYFAARYVARRRALVVAAAAAEQESRVGMVQQPH